MTTSIRKIMITIGLLCVVAGGVLIWRATHPRLSDEQIIYNNLASLQEAAQNRQTRTVASYLSRDFTWTNMSRREFIHTMSGAFFETRDVQLTLSNVDLTRPTADTAITTGEYSVVYRMSQGAPADNARGSFKLYWRKEGGEWKVYQAEGGTNIGG